MGYKALEKFSAQNMRVSKKRGINALMQEIPRMTKVRLMFHHLVMKTLQHLLFSARWKDQCQRAAKDNPK